MSLIDLLFKKGLIDKDKAFSLSVEAKKNQKKEEEFLLEKKIVSEEELFNFKSEILKIPLKEVVVRDISLDILELIPEETSKYYQMIPLAREKNILQVGMVFPEDLKAQEALKFFTRQQNLELEIYLITGSTFNALLKQYRTLKKEVGRALEELEVELKTERESFPRSDAEFERLAEEAPITKIVAVVLRHAVEGEASDIHIEPCRNKLKVRFRLMGFLHSSIFLPKKVHLAVVARIKILSNLKLDESRIPQDGRFSAKVNDKDIDFRVSTLPTTLGEKVVIRVLDPSTGMKKFEDLGLEKRNYQVVDKATKKPFGLILSTGPTGCGKTTTLYAILNLLNKEESNVITLEDPVEYFIEGVNQSQVRPEIGYDFPVGLRHILRQDPDVIMVGEIRDEETAALAIHAALTGHMVLSTLHTSNAIGAIPRLIDLGVKDYLISPTLSCIIAQRLIRKLCDFCKKKIEPSKKIKGLILKEIENFPPQQKKEFKDLKSLEVWTSVGCKKCNNEGFSGRVGLYEVLEMTDILANLILESPTPEKLTEEAKRQGMITLKQDGIIKAIKGITSIEEVFRITEEQNKQL